VSDQDAAPCPACRQFVAMSERSCPHCGASVLVDLVVTSTLADARERYRLARALVPLAEGRVTATALQSSLASGRGRLLSSVTREAAEQAAALVRAASVSARIQRAGTAARPEAAKESSGRWWLFPAVLAVLAAVGAGTWLALRSNVSKEATPTADAAALPKLSPTQVAARGLAAAVALRCGEQLGSGFFVDEERLVTNAHVLCPGEPTIGIRFSSGREATGEIEATDDALDLAIVRAAGAKAAALPLGDAGELKVGERLTMIGSPLGMDFSVHEASVSNLERHELGVAFVQIDARVNPGNSGGPLIDDRGRVVAIVTLKRMDAEGIAFAVPVNYLYTGASPMLAAQARQPSVGFVRMTARAEGASREEAEALASTGQRPGLVGALILGDMIQAKVLWPSAQEPFVTTLSFTLWNGPNRLCSLTGEVDRWTKVAAADGGSILTPRVKAWLDGHGFSSDLYVAVARMKWDECPDEPVAGNVELELENADADASRVRFGVE
jgi:S1-C subfamily serine protease